MKQIRLEPPEELRMAIGEAMFTQRAIRKLRPDPIRDEHVEIILNAASKAPSAGNIQPARYLVIRDPARVRAFGELYHEAWWAKRRDSLGWKSRDDIPAGDGTALAAAQLADEMGAAPLVILVFSVLDAMDHSIFPGVQNLMLAARALGIGTTLTTLHPDVMERLYRLLEVPEQPSLYCCIPMGYPRGRFGPTPRQRTAETTYYDTWGAPPPWA